MSKKVTLESLETNMHDLLQVVQTGFLRTETRFDMVENKLGELDTRMYQVERRMGSLEIRFEDMNDTMLEFQETIGNHEGRIVRLEKRRAGQ